MVAEFRKFLFRGNVLDLAVAVVIAGAFGVVITALVKDRITPLLAAIGGQPNFAGLTFTVHHAPWLYGDFVDAVVCFVIVAAAIFYLVVLPATVLNGRMEKPAAPRTKACPQGRSEIPLPAGRCACGTAQQP